MEHGTCHSNWKRRPCANNTVGPTSTAHKMVGTLEASAENATTTATRKLLKQCGESQKVTLLRPYMKHTSICEVVRELPSNRPLNAVNSVRPILSNHRRKTRCQRNGRWPGTQAFSSSSTTLSMVKYSGTDPHNRRNRG